MRFEGAGGERTPRLNCTWREGGVLGACAHLQHALERRCARGGALRNPERPRALLGARVRAQVSEERRQQPLLPRIRRLHLIGREKVLVHVVACREKGAGRHAARHVEHLRWAAARGEGERKFGGEHPAHGPTDEHERRAGRVGRESVSEALHHRCLGARAHVWIGGRARLGRLEVGSLTKFGSLTRPRHVSPSAFAGHLDPDHLHPLGRRARELGEGGNRTTRVRKAVG